MLEATCQRQSNAPRVASLLLGSLLLGAVGCSARADIPEVVVTQSDVVFEGVPRLAGLVPIGEISATFDHPDGFSFPEYFNPELYPVEMKVAGRGDMQDLSFIRRLELTLGSRSEDAPADLVVATYERTADGTVGRELDVDTDRQADVLEYWGIQSAYYNITLWGDDLPVDSWSVDVTVEFTGQLSIGSD
jgi:hypothetical protein